MMCKDVFKYSIDANKINLNIEMVSRNQFEHLKAAMLCINLFKHSNDAKTSVLAFERQKYCVEPFSILHMEHKQIDSNI